MGSENSLVNQFSGLLGLPREIIIKAITFGGSLLEEPLSELTQIFVDDIRYLRVRNQVNLLIKANSYFEKNGLNPNKVPVKILVPLLEGCSLEEDDSLQKMWESLLINSALPTNNITVLSGYIDILKQLSPQEVKLLDYIYNEYRYDEFTTSSFKLYNTGTIINGTIELYLDNFIRMNLIKNILPELLYNELEEEEKQSKSYFNLSRDLDINIRYYDEMSLDTYKLTKLGLHFILSCKIDDNNIDD